MSEGVVDVPDDIALEVEEFDGISMDTQMNSLGKFNNLANNNKPEKKLNTAGNTEYSDSGYIAISQKTRYNDDFIDRYHLIKERLTSLIPKLYSTMIYIKYKSSILRFGYKTSSILIIILSSIITFMEALRANTSPDERTNMIITLMTLSFGFIIALTASIVKFFNLQNKIEKLHLLNNMLENPYLEASKLLEKISVIPDNMIDENTVIKIKEEWEKIIDQYTRPYIDAHNIIHPDKLTQYMLRYNTQKKQIDDIRLYNDNIKTIREIEEYTMVLKTELSRSLHTHNTQITEITLNRLDHLVSTLDRMNASLDTYKNIINKIYNRDNLNRFTNEVDNIEWYKAKNIKRKIRTCFTKCCSKKEVN